MNLTIQLTLFIVPLVFLISVISFSFKYEASRKIGKYTITAWTGIIFGIIWAALSMVAIVYLDISNFLTLWAAFGLAVSNCLIGIIMLLFLRAVYDVKGFGPTLKTVLALAITVPIVIVSFLFISSNYIQKEDNFTKEQLARISRAQEIYYEQNDNYTDQINQLIAIDPQIKDDSSIALLVSTDNDTDEPIYTASIGWRATDYEPDDIKEGDIGKGYSVQGIPGEKAAVCDSVPTCDNKKWDIDAIDLAPITPADATPSYPLDPNNFAGNPAEETENDSDPDTN